MDHDCEGHNYIGHNYMPEHGEAEASAQNKKHCGGDRDDDTDLDAITI